MNNLFSTWRKEIKALSGDSRYLLRSLIQSAVRRSLCPDRLLCCPVQACVHFLGSKLVFLQAHNPWLNLCIMEIKINVCVSGSQTQFRTPEVFLHKTYRGLIFKIANSSYHSTTTENPIKKWAEDLNSHSSKEDRWPRDTCSSTQQH